MDSLNRISGRLSAFTGAGIAICVFNTLLIGILWQTTIDILDADREKTIAAAVVNNDNLTIALEQYVRSNLKLTDTVLRHVARETTHGSAGELEALVNLHVRGDRNIAGIVVADGNGTPVVSALISNPQMAVTMADQAHFRIHVDNDTDRIHIGKPMISRVANRLLVPVTRRITRPDGSFGGVAMALLEPASFTNLLHDATLGPANIISVVGLDGITRARLRGTQPSSGEDISASPLFREQAQRANGHYYAQGQIDGVPRYFSYRTIPEYRLLATVGTAESELLADHQLRDSRYRWFAGIATTLVALFTLILAYALQRQQRSAAELARRRAQYAATFNQSAIGMAHVGTDERLLEVNQKLCDMLGCRRTELLSQSLADITHPDDVDRGSTYHRQRLDGNDEEILCEKRLLCKNGSTVWTLQTVSPVRDGAGRIDYCAYVIQDISDRKWLEAAARSRAREFDDLVSLLPVAVYVCSLSGTIETCNRSAVELWGRTPKTDDDTERFCGSYRIYQPDGTPIPHAERPLAQVLKTGNPVVNREIRIERPDGTRRAVLVNATPRRDSEGRITGAINCLIDITDRLDAERRARDLMRSLIDASPTGIIAYRATGPAVFANAAIAHMIGCTVEQALSQNFREILTWQASGLLAQAESALATGKPRAMELNTVSSFGRKISLDCRLIPFTFLDEPHLLCFFDDLSEEKRMLAALRDSETRLRNAQRIAHMGHWDLDVQTNTLYWSDQIYEIFGLDKSRFTANYQAFMERVHPDDRTGMERAQREALNGSGLLDFEHRIVLPDGTVKFVHELGELTRDADDRPLRLSGTVTDITHRKMLEDALRERARQMQDLAQQLSTVEETERRSIHRELHDQVGANLSALKLDLNLLDARLDSAARAAVAGILDQAHQLALDTTVRVRNVMAELRPVALDDFGLTEALRVYAESLDARLKIPVAVIDDDGVPRLPLATETALFRIAQEALNNIAKHARATRVTIMLKVSESHVVLRIEDDGIGFDPADTDTRRGHWGLRTMHERALSIGAELQIDSTRGRGARITIKVPRACP